MSIRTRIVPSIVMSMTKAVGQTVAAMGSPGRATFESLEQRTLMAAQPGAASSSMAYDAAGNLHLAYYDEAAKVLKYTRQSPAGAWTTAITIDASSSDMGKMPSLAVNSAGRPGVAYFDATNEDLRYAFSDGTTWKTVAVDTKESVGQNPSLAFDTRNGAVISYYRKTTGDLRLATLTNLAKNKWTVTTIARKGDAGQFSSVAIDPVTNKPTVAFSDATGKVQVATKAGGGFQKPVVIDQVSSNVTNVSVAFGANGGPTISYFDPTSGSIKLAEAGDPKAKFFTNEEIAVVPAGSNANPTLVINPVTKKPQVVYYDAETNGVFLARKPADGTTTEKQQLKAGGGDGFIAAPQPGNDSISFAVVDTTGTSDSPVDLGNTESTPLPPTEVSAVAIHSTEVALLWADNSGNETGFLVERATGGSDWTVVGQTTPDVVNFTDSTVSEATTYYYRVSATGGAGETAVGTTAPRTYGNAIVGVGVNTAASITTPPNAPTNLQADVVSDAQVNLTWMDNSAAETAYVLERSGDSGQTWTPIVLSANTASYSDAGLAEGKAYLYRVYARRGVQASLLSNEVDVVTQPAAPRGLTVTQISTSQLNIAWTNTASAYEHVVLERSTNGTNWTVVTNLPMGVSTYNHAGLSEGTAYYFRVKAVAELASAYSNVGNSTTNPLAPSNLSATAVSSSRIDLAWTDNTAGETGYLVQRSTAGGSFVTIATVDADVTTYADAGRTEGVSYAYRIKAVVGEDAQSVFSAEVGTMPLPSAPTNLVAELTDAGAHVLLTWSDNATGEVGFQIQRQAFGSSTWNTIATPASNVTSYTDTSAAEATTYTYRLRATNDGGVSAFTDNYLATTVPVAPSGLIIETPSHDQITLAWSDNSDGETGYVIERSTGGSDYAAIATTDAGVTTFADEDVDPATAYTYRVKAINGGGSSAYTAVVSGTTRTVAPAGLSVEGKTATEVELSWSAVTGAASYRVERTANDGETWVAIEDVEGLSYTDDVAEASGYGYRVRAINDGGVSDASNEVTVITLPSAPTGLAMTAVSSGSVTLSWEDHSDGETGYKVERSSDGGDTFDTSFDVAIDGETYTDSTVVEGSDYVYRVVAIGAGGSSDYSTEVTVSTLPGTPTDVVVEATSSTEITVSWTDQSASEDRFEVEISTDGETFNYAGQAVAGVTSLDLTVPEGSSPIVRVRAVRGGVFSAYSGTDSTDTIPAAATGVQVTAVTTSSISLSWTDASSHETAYRVERSIDGENFSSVGDPAVNATTFTDTGLTEGTVYHYRIVTVQETLESISGEVQTQTTPAAPTNLQASSAVAGTVVLTWTNNAASATGLAVERKNSEGEFVSIATPSAGVTTYSDTSVTPGAAHTYRVIATQTINSLPSNEVEGMSRPDAPLNVTKSNVTATGVSLSWDAAHGATGYTVEVSDNGGADWAVADSTTTETSLVVTGLDESGDYSYRVIATNSVGASVASTVVAVHTLPMAPSDLTATATDPTQVDLAWTDNSTSGLASIVIYRALGELPGDDAYALLTTLPTGSESYSDLTAQGGIAYSYRVIADDGTAVSGSVTDSVTTPPAAVTGLNAVSSTPTTVAVTWAASTGASSYAVERSLDGITFDAPVTVSTNSYTDEAAVEATEYTYRVTPVGIGGTGPSAADTATTLPAGVAAINLAGYTDTTVEFSWGDPSQGETGFRIERSTDGEAWTTLTVTAPNVTTYTDSAAAEATTYAYRAIPVSDGGDGSAAVLDVTTLPAAASAVMAEGVSATEVTVSWDDNSDGETSYTVLRSQGGSFDVLASGLAANTEGYADTTVLPGTQYVYKVIAVGVGGSSEESNTASVTTVPAALTDVAATMVSTTQLDLAWSDVGGNTSYRIERKAAGGSFSEIVNALTADATGYSDTTVSEGTTYTYRVYAVNAGGDSAASNDATATTPPVAPSALTADDTSATAISLAWEDNSVGETSITIERFDGLEWSELISLDPGTESYVDTVAPGSTFSYRVYATNDGGDSGLSGVVAATTVPAQVTGVTAAANSTTTVAVSWTKVSGATGYRVLRSDDNGSTFSQLGLDLDADADAYTDSTTAEATAYVYQVVAFNASGEGGVSSNVAAATPPEAPTGVAATAVTATSLSLTFTDHSANESGFEIERSTDGGDTWGPAATPDVVLGAGDTGSTLQTGLAEGTTYLYRARATFADQVSAWSTPYSVDTTPLAPTGLTVSSFTDSSISLAWTDNSNGEAGYELERSDDGGDNWTPLTPLAPNANTFTDPGRSQSASYLYRLRAYRGTSQSAFTSDLAVTTRPAAVTSLVATPVNSTSIELTWADNATAEDGFKIERSVDAGESWMQIAAPAAGETTYTDTLAPESATSIYRVTAYKASIDSAVSSEVSATTPVAAPSGLVVMATSHSAISLAWSDNSNVATAQRIERTTDGIEWNELVVVDAGQESYSDTTVTEDSEYEYRIVAIKGVAESNASMSDSATTPLAAPTSLAAVSPTATSVSLTWTNVSTAAEDIVVERSSDNGGQWDALVTVDASDNSYLDTTVTEGTAYQYRVGAVKSGNASSTTAAVGVTTLPATPSDFDATVFSASQIDLSWTDNAGSETGYRIDRSVNGGEFEELTEVGAGVEAYSDSTTHEGGTFAYLVYALGAGGASATATDSAITAPAAPTAFAATPVTATQIDLAWTDVSNGETSYVVERSTDGGDNWSALVTLDENISTYSDKTVLEAHSYDYRVRAERTGVASDWVMDAATTVPSTPTNLATTVPAGTPRVNLSWTDTSGGENGFAIERSTDGENWLLVHTASTNAGSYSDTAVTEGSTYIYRVAATSAAGNSVWSVTANASTLPTTPSGLTSIVSGPTTVSLSWSDNSAHEEGYLVERSVGGVNWSVVATLGENANSHADTSVSEAVTYQYRVRAFTAAVNGSPSESASVSTPLAAPTSLVATVTSTSQINLTWVDHSAVESNYKIERAVDGGGFSPLVTVVAGTTSYSDSTATAGTTYVYRIRGTKGPILSDYATSAAVTTAPTAPASLTAVAASHSHVTLNWVDGQGETAYTVERSANAGETWATLSTVVAANANTYTDTTGVEETSYVYRIKATNSAGASAYVTSALVTTLPAAPDDVDATTQSTDSILVTWTDRSAAESSFRIERQIELSGDWQEIAVVGGNVTSYLDSTGDESVAYEYRVRATSGGRNSAYSHTAVASTLPFAPDSLVVVAATSTTVELTWNNPSTAPTMVIERSTDGGDTFSAVATAGQGTTSYTHTGLSPETTYVYRIRAFNGDGGFSDPSNTVLAVTTV